MSRQGWPIEPEPSRWEFPDPEIALHQDYVGEGADLEPGTVLEAYRRGIFPMPVRTGAPPSWWSPARRGILPLDRLRVSRSLRQSGRKYDVRIDTEPERVVEACADPSRPGGWITKAVVGSYLRLFRMGWMHTVEAWNAEGELVGGLYGLAIGGLFAGESMFHHERDASKVALVALVDLLRGAGDPQHRLLDTQWRTPHLGSLGAIDVDRSEYLRLLDHALRLPLPETFARPDGRAAGGEVGSTGAETRSESG